MMVGSGADVKAVMRERDKRRVGEQIEPGGRPKAPGRLALLQRFINTHNHDFPPEWDRIATPQAATAWLRQAKLIAEDDRVTKAGVARLQQLRDGLRALAIANHPNQPQAAAATAAAAAISNAAATAKLRIAISPQGQTALKPAANGAGAATATLLSILHETQLSGHWPRLKGCRRCGYAFYDRSKNKSAAWCAMSICGNRTKNHTYYHRHHTTPQTPATRPQPTQENRRPARSDRRRVSVAVADEQ